MTVRVSLFSCGVVQDVGGLRSELKQAGAGGSGCLADQLAVFGGSLLGGGLTWTRRTARPRDGSWSNTGLLAKEASGRE